MSAPGFALMSVKVFSAGSGELIWGPTQMPTTSVVGDVAASLGKSEIVSLMHHDKKLDPCALLSSLRASESDVLCLVAVFTPWSALLDEKFPAMVSFPFPVPDIAASEHIQEIEKSCGAELPGDVKACLSFFLEERRGKGPFFEAPFTAVRCHQPGLLYWNWGREDTMESYWIDLFGQFAEVLGIPAKEACGHVWNIESYCGGDLFDESVMALRRRLNVPEATIAEHKTLTIAEWKELLLYGVDGCSVYGAAGSSFPICVANSLPDFLSHFNLDEDGYYPPTAGGCYPDSWSTLVAEVLRKQEVVHEATKLKMAEDKQRAAELEVQHKKELKQELEEIDKSWGTKGNMQDMDSIDMSLQRGLELEAGHRKDQRHREHLKAKEARKHFGGHPSQKLGNGQIKGVGAGSGVRQSSNKSTIGGYPEQSITEEKTMPASTNYVERDKVRGARQIVSKAYTMDLPASDDDDDVDS